MRRLKYNSMHTMRLPGPCPAIRYNAFRPFAVPHGSKSRSGFSFRFRPARVELGRIRKGLDLPLVGTP